MEMLNITKEFDFDEYTSFFDHKFNTILEKALIFNLKLSNLNNITGERAKGILYHELMMKDLELKRLQGFAAPILSTFEQSVINDREAILILIGKLHEYVASLKLELASVENKTKNYGR